jgi:AraC-like DNA-binding protein
VNYRISAGETPIFIELMNAERYMFEKMGDFRQGYGIMKRINAMKDSLFSLEKPFSIHDLELFYQNEQVNLKNQKLQLSVSEMKARNYTIKIILGVAMVGLMALAGFLYVFYKLYRQRDIAYTALFEKYKYDMTVVPAGTLKEAPIGQESDMGTYIHKLTLEIEAYFANSKPYLNQQLKVEDVAQKLGVTQKQVSAALKSTYGLHFNVFVNKYRIQEALKLLANLDYQYIKIEHIAKEVGFGSKVSFYNAFAQITGSKPSDYRMF